MKFRTIPLFFSLFLFMSIQANASNYCHAYGKHGTYGWIKEVKFGSMWSGSGWSSGGYADYTHKTTSCYKGSSYSINLKPHHEKHDEAYWGVWIDYNQDGYYSDQEKVVTATSYYEINKSIHIPSNCKSGYTTMRVAMRYFHEPTACGYYWYGEVEDYKIQINDYIDDHHYDPNYCKAYGKNSTHGYITNVKINEINKSSGFSYGGYADYTQYHANVMPGGEYKIDLTAKMPEEDWHSTPEIARWAVWVDLNHNYKFEDSEKLLSKSSHDPLSEWIRIPDNAKAGKTRMRIAVRYVYNPKECGYYWYGEVEDYTLNIEDKLPDHPMDPINYCDAAGHHESYGYIKHVEIGTIDHGSSYASHGYGNYSHYSSDAWVGDKIVLKLTPELIGWYDGWYTHYQRPFWAVWIDFDHDGSFESHEKVLKAHTSYPISKTIDIPWGAKAGPTRVRIALRFFDYPHACGDFYYGEVEDYTIHIKEKIEEPEPEVDYCTVYGKNDTYGWIKHVKLGSIDKTSAFAWDGYADYTNYSTSLWTGNNQINLYAYLKEIYHSHYGWTVEKPFWKVWIDFDHDGKFEESEIVLDKWGESHLSSTIHVPYSAKNGKTRMRVALRFIYAPEACGYYWYGEVEDYSVNISGNSGGYREGYNLESNLPVQEKVVVFPNPTMEEISLSNTPNGTIELTIYNSLGIQVKRLWYSEGARIDVRDLRPGNYYIRSSDLINQEVVPFVKH